MDISDTMLHRSEFEDAFYADHVRFAVKYDKRIKAAEELFAVDEYNIYIDPTVSKFWINWKHQIAQGKTPTLYGGHE